MSLVDVQVMVGLGESEVKYSLYLKLTFSNYKEIVGE